MKKQLASRQCLDAMISFRLGWLAIVSEKSDFEYKNECGISIATPSLR